MAKTLEEREVQRIARRAARRLERMIEELAEAAGRLPAPDPEELARMEARELPFSLAASLRRDLEALTAQELADALTGLRSAAVENRKTLRRAWRSWRAS